MTHDIRLPDAGLARRARQGEAREEAVLPSPEGGLRTGRDAAQVTQPPEPDSSPLSPASYPLSSPQVLMAEAALMDPAQVGAAPGFSALLRL